MNYIIQRVLLVWGTAIASLKSEEYAEALDKIV